MSLTDPPTPEEQSSAARRYGGTIRRGRHLAHRRLLSIASSGAVAAVALGVGLALTLPAGKQTRVNVIAPSTVPFPGTTEPPSTISSSTSTTMRTGPFPPPTTDVSITQAADKLQLFLATQAATERAAAQSAGQTWNGYLHTAPISDSGRWVAVAAFSYDAKAEPLEVLVFSNGRWTEIAGLPAPPGQGYITPSGAAMNSNWLANFTGATISVADVTKDGRPDFLIPLGAADNSPAAVVSQDGTPSGSGWRYVPYIQGSSSNQGYIFSRDARFQGTSLLTTYDNCNPSCAGGTNVTITWTYESKYGVFWLPNPS